MLLLSNDFLRKFDKKKKCGKHSVSNEEIMC